MSKRYTADLEGKSVLLRGEDVSSLVEWVDVEGGRALMRDAATGVASFVRGVFVVGSEKKKQKRDVAADTEQTKKEKKNETQPRGKLRRRRRTPGSGA